MNVILQKLKDNKEQLFSKYPIKSLALFGSRAREDYREDSDVDVMVEFSKPVGMEFIRLAHELEDMFSYKVDLVSKKGVKPHYLKVIEKDLQYV
jgi:predicted nucleotidyltransferase